MTELVVVGLSHHTAPIAVRERLNVATDSIASELRLIVGAGAVAEGVLLSTCNRVELYGAAGDPVAAARAIRAHLASRALPESIEPYLYERFGGEAVRHAFRVAASLDSMVVGEPQILGQVKSAFATAEAAGAIGTVLSRCFHRAFAVAKRVRTETGVASGAVSVSSIAIELASKIFGHLDGRHTLLVGAGKMSEAAAKSLAKRGARLYVVNRSAERAEQLALACGGDARPYEALAVELAAADVVITSTASPRFVITRDLMKDVIRARRHRPLFLIDIAVPRDVDPRCGEMENVFLYDVDDLQKVAAANLSHRQRATSDAEAIVLDESESFERWRRSLTLTPTIVALREQFQSVLRGELERTLPRLGTLGEAERATLERMTDAMVNKLLHGPLSELKRGADGPEAPLLIDATRKLFQLEPASSPPPSAEAATEDPVTSLAPAREGNRS